MRIEQLALLLYRTCLHRAQLPTAISLGKDADDLVLTSEFPSVIKPGCGIPRGQYRGLAEHAHTELLALDVFNLQIAGRDVGDELRLIVAFERIREEEIVGHDSVQCRRICADHCFDPIVVELTHVPFDFESRVRRRWG
jgi:hypothetical protein